MKHILLLILILIISCTKQETIVNQPLQLLNNQLKIGDKIYNINKGYSVSYPNYFDKVVSDLTKEMNNQIKLAGNNQTAINTIKSTYQLKITSITNKKNEGFNVFAYCFFEKGLEVILNNNDFNDIAGKGSFIIIVLWSKSISTPKDGIYSLLNPSQKFDITNLVDLISQTSYYIINKDTFKNSEESYSDFVNGTIKLDKNIFTIDSKNKLNEQCNFHFNSQLTKITDNSYQIFY